MPGLGIGVLRTYGWGLSLEVKATIIQSEQMPEDFAPGALDFILDSDGLPNDTYAFYILAVVKDFRTRNKKIIPGFTAGIAYTEKEISTNFIKDVPCTSFSCSWTVNIGSNYYYDLRKTKSTGLFLKPKLKYVFSRFAAIETAAWTILTLKGSYYGVELSLLFGD